MAASWTVSDYLHYGQTTEYVGTTCYHTRLVQASLTVGGSDYPDCSEALDAVIAKYPLWSPRWVNGTQPTYSGSWLYGYEVTEPGLHSQVALKYVTWNVLDPNKRPPGDVKMHVIGTREGEHYKADVVGRDYPVGVPAGILPAPAIGSPREEGAPWWKPRCYYVLDAVIPKESFAPGTFYAYLLYVNSGDFYWYPAWDRTTGVLIGPGPGLVAGSTLLLTDIDAKPLENGNYQILYTFAYDPIAYHKYIWYGRNWNVEPARATYDLANPIHSKLYRGTVNFADLPGLDGGPNGMLETYAPQVTPE